MVQLAFQERRKRHWFYSVALFVYYQCVENSRTQQHFLNLLFAGILISSNFTNEITQICLLETTSYHVLLALTATSRMEKDNVVKPSLSGSQFSSNFPPGQKTDVANRQCL